MAAIGITVSYWQSLPAATRTNIRQNLSTRVRLGDPVTLVIAGVDWFCFDDDRLSRVTTARIIERFPSSTGNVRGCDEDWSGATPKEGL